MFNRLPKQPPQPLPLTSFVSSKNEILIGLQIHEFPAVRARPFVLVLLVLFVRFRGFLKLFAVGHVLRHVIVRPEDAGEGNTDGSTAIHHRLSFLH